MTTIRVWIEFRKRTERGREKNKHLEARSLIKAGVGNTAQGGGKDISGFEVVSCQPAARL